MVLDDTKQMEIKIERDEAQNCSLLVPELENTRISLSASDVGDIEVFFNRAFKWIVENHELISFYITDDKNDLYTEVAKELVAQMNSEIGQSEKDFYAIIEILNNKDDAVVDYNETDN